jgi:hypothetical protein
MILKSIRVWTEREKEELDGPAVSALSVRSQKLSNVGQSGWVTKIKYLERLRSSEGTLSR